MRFRELILEDDLTVMKQDIIKRLMGLDVDPDDQKKTQEVETILDRIYQLLNTQSTFDKFKDIVAQELQNEYGQAADKKVQKTLEKRILNVASKIAEIPMRHQDKMKFADNLKAGKVINAELLLKPGQYTLQDLTYNQPENLLVFDYLKDYGIGEQMKGPGEHALAILSPDITLKSAGGDVAVKGVPVEVKASRSGGGGGRFGEATSVPTKERMLEIINSFEQLREPMAQALSTQKSMNVKKFTELVNQSGLDAPTRKVLSSKLFGELFGAEAGPLINTFARPNADPEQVVKAYTVANFNHYKAGGEGGQWQLLAAINFGANTMAVVKTGEDVLRIKRYTSTPAIITTGKPNEALYQFTPAA
jgi:hypothetical protein